MMRTPRGLVALMAGSLLAFGCASPTGSNGTPSTNDGDAARPPRSSPCPGELVLHTSRPPSSDLGFIYGLFDSMPEVEPGTTSVHAPIGHNNPALGSNSLRLVHGGTSDDFERPLGRLLTDEDVDLALVDSDELIAFMGTQVAGDAEAISVFAPFEISDSIIFWDEDAHPDTRTISDLKKWDIRVLYADGSYFMDYLVSSGQLWSTQAVNTLDGTPIPFIASGGRIVKQGSSTLDPYAYRNLYRDWMKDVSYQYIHDMGWTPYPLTLTVRSSDIERLSPCLEVLVPEMQRSQLRFLEDPEDTASLIAATSRSLDMQWSYTIDQALAAHDRIVADGLVSRTPDRPIGDQDRARIDTLIDLFTRHVAGRRGLLMTPVESDAIVTNRFLDASIVP